MRFKHNPWVSLLAALVLTIIIVFFCTNSGNAAEMEPPSRMHIEYDGTWYGVSFLIITDKETSAQYLFCDGVNGSGLMKLEG